MIYHMILLLASMSAGLLAAAFAFEIFGGLLPCKLCIWQRWPHGLIAVVALLGLAALRPNLVFLAIGLLALAMRALLFIMSVWNRGYG